MAEGLDRRWYGMQKTVMATSRQFFLWVGAPLSVALGGVLLAGSGARVLWESSWGTGLAPVAEAQVAERPTDSRTGVSFHARDSGVLIGGASLGQKTSLDVFAVQRQLMVDRQIKRRGVRQIRVLEAMNKVPRHEFVPNEVRSQAYKDSPVAIDDATSISQPYIVALMTECLELDGDEKVLEIGTGSGYHSAVLSQVARKVHTIEIDRKLADKARRNLARLGYTNVKTLQGDGYQGWPEEAPSMRSFSPPPLPHPRAAHRPTQGRWQDGGAPGRIPTRSVGDHQGRVRRHQEGRSAGAAARDDG